MIDSLEGSRRLWARSRILERLRLKKGHYGIVALHRPSHVGEPQILNGSLDLGILLASLHG